MYRDNFFNNNGLKSLSIFILSKISINFVYEFEPSIVGTIGITKSKNFVRSLDSKASSRMRYKKLSFREILFLLIVGILRNISFFNRDHLEKFLSKTIRLFANILIS